MTQFKHFGQEDKSLSSLLFREIDHVDVNKLGVARNERDNGKAAEKEKNLPSFLLPITPRARASLVYIQWIQWTSQETTGTGQMISPLRAMGHINDKASIIDDHIV